MVTAALREDEPALAAEYERYKLAFQVPWVGVVTMAYARHDAFFRCWWDGMRDVVESKAYVIGALALRQRIEAAVAKLRPPPIVPRLLKLGYSPREIDDIGNILEFLSHGNVIQTPAVFAARLLMEGGELSGRSAPMERFDGRHAVVCRTPFVLMEPHHADASLAALYADVRDRLDLPIVNTDYRAMARWPSYFALAWGDLRPHLGTRSHEALAADLHDAIFTFTAQLPNPGGLSADGLRAAARADGDEALVRDITRLFTHLIPGLFVNVAFFREQLRLG